MRSLLSFTKKEFTEQYRSGRLLILLILFVLFGVMNPAVAKLTPRLLEMFADSLSESGMTVTEVSVSAMDSWVQFYKNMPMALIAFVLLQSALFTREYASGTLLLSLTKGLRRHTVVISKTAVLTLLWTAGYWLCYAVTYAYNAYYWDNSVAENLIFSALCWWVFGLLVIMLIVLFSALSSSNSAALLGTGATVLICYLVGLLPKISKYLPTFLTDGNSLIYAIENKSAYIPALIIAGAATILCFVLSIVIFNKKQL